MVRFALNQTIETAEPTIAVDARLPPRRHPFRRLVIEDGGHPSQPVDKVNELQREIVPPPPVIPTDPRTGPVRPPLDPILGPTVGDSAGPPGAPHSSAEPAGAPQSDPVPPRRKRSRKPGGPPAKKPRRPRRKE